MTLITPTAQTLPALVGFRLAWRIVIDRPCHLPSWKGSLLRGILGWGLERVAKQAPSPGWPGLVSGSALARILLDPQAAWADQMAAAPWAIQCPDVRTAFTAGETLSGSLILHGPWPGWCRAMLHEAFANGVAGGLGSDRVPARIEGWHDEPLEAQAPVVGAHGCLIATRTPCRLQDRSADCSTLSPSALVRSVLRRWRQLHRQTHGQEPISGERFQQLSRRCDDLAETAGLHLPVRLDRFSNRQVRSHPLDAIQGWVRVSGPGFSDLAPIIAWAEHLHVGRQPCFGLGQVALGWDVVRDARDARHQESP